MKIAVTGGHITPALAVISLLQERGHDVVVIGRRYAQEGDTTDSFEYQQVSKRGIPFYEIQTGRLQRKFTKHTIPSLSRVPLGFFQSYRHLTQIKPDVVLSFGSYVAVPVAIAAKVLRIPVITHEQTMTVGLSTKLIATVAKVVCVSFEETKALLPNTSTILTGNPIRPELLDSPSNEFADLLKDGLPLLYITGGSLGSHMINTLVRQTIEELTQFAVVFHQTGQNPEFADFDDLVKYKEEKSLSNYIVQKYVDAEELTWIYNTAQCLVGRAGANTVTEILHFAIPSLLVPLPISANNEQQKQAQYIEDVGLGKCINQDDLTPTLFVRTLREMIERHNEYRNARHNYTDTSTQAAAKIADITLSAHETS